MLVFLLDPLAALLWPRVRSGRALTQPQSLARLVALTVSSEARSLPRWQEPKVYFSPAARDLAFAKPITIRETGKADAVHFPTDVILDWRRSKQQRQLLTLCLVLATILAVLAARIAYLLNS